VKIEYFVQGFVYVPITRGRGAPVNDEATCNLLLQKANVFDLQLPYQKDRPRCADAVCVDVQEIEGVGRIGLYERV
jgi:hypothetical protein